MFEPGSIEVPRRRHTRRPAGIEKRPGRPIIRSHSLSNHSASACGAREWKRRLRPAKLSRSATEMSRRRVTHSRYMVQNPPAAHSNRRRSQRAPFKPFSSPRSPAPGHAVTAQNSPSDGRGAGPHRCADSPSRRPERRATLSCRAGGGWCCVKRPGAPRRRVSWAADGQAHGCCTRWA